MNNFDWIVVGSNGGIGRPLLAMLAKDHRASGLSSKGGVLVLLRQLKELITKQADSPTALIYLCYTRNPIYNIALLLIVILQTRHLRKLHFYYFSTFSINPSRRGIFPTKHLPEFSGGLNFYNINKLVSEYAYVIFSRYFGKAGSRFFTVCPTFVTGEGTKFGNRILELATCTTVVLPARRGHLPVLTVNELKNALVSSTNGLESILFENMVQIRNLFSADHCGRALDLPIFVESQVSLFESIIKPARLIDWPYFFMSKVPVLKNIVLRKYKRAGVGSFPSDVFHFSVE